MSAKFQIDESKSEIKDRKIGVVGLGVAYK